MTNFRKFPNRQAFEFTCREAAPQSIYLGKGRALCEILGRQVKIFVPTADLTMTPHLLLSGFWESWITLYVQNLVKPGWRVVNVGAAFGYYTLLCAALGAEVVAFEPQAELVKLIRMSVELNGFMDKCKVVSAACGDDIRRIPIYVDPQRVGGGTVQTRSAPENSTPDNVRHLVQMTTLDAHFDARNSSLPKVDLIIIDVEGHEPEVIEGAKQLLEYNHGAIIILEFSPPWYKDAAGFARTLRTRYDIHDITGDGTLKPMTDDELLSGHQTTVALVPSR